MIEISPSVLTNSISEFTRFVKAYEEFDSVDIDIIRRPFLEDETISIEDAVKVLEDYKCPSIGFHLMVQDPEKDLEFLKSSGFLKKALRIYFQQESDISFLKEYTWPANWSKCISIKLETKLNNLNFYNQFDEVQFMSVEIGKQGNKFQEVVLDKIEELKEMGYNGKISLDGGINLKTANIIRHWGIQRVSPGSYFAKAEDVKFAKMKLDLALNMKDGADYSH